MTTFKIKFTSKLHANFFRQDLKKIQEKQSHLSFMQIEINETDTLFYIDSDENFISGFNNGYLTICFKQGDIYNSILVFVHYIDCFENYKKLI